MTVTQSAPGAAPAVAGTIAAVAAAASGGSDGFKAAMDRMDAILSADGIKGDASRMNAALSLAKASPDMPAEAVVAFVKDNVPAAKADQPAPAPAAATQSYEATRVAAANLAMPSGGQAASTGPKISASSIYDMRRKSLKGE